MANQNPDQLFASAPAADSASGMEFGGDETFHAMQGGNSRGGKAKNILRRIRKTLTVAHSNSTVTTTTVTDGSTPWTVTVKNGRVYRIRALGTYQTAATGTGCIFGLRNVVTATGVVQGFIRGAISALAVATGLEVPLIALTGTLTTTGVNAINTPHQIYMEFIFVCTADGTFDVGFASEVAASAAQLNIGSTLLIEDIT